jgi:hypothetical protein
VITLNLYYTQHVCRNVNLAKVIGKEKGQATNTQNGSRGAALLPLTSALDGLGSQRHAPATLLPVMTRQPLYTRLGGTQVWFGQVRKISPHQDSIPGLSSP